MTHRAVALFLIALVCAGARAQETGPITSFEQDIAPLAAAGATVERVTEHATDGEYALKVTFPGSEQDTWPGVWVRPVDTTDWTRHQILTMDVFVEGDTPQTLSYRLDSADGKKSFGSRPLKPGLNENLSFHIAAEGANVDLTNVSGLYLYARIPHETWTIYIDDLRWDTFEGRFKRTIHVDPRPAPEPTAEQAQRGFIAFSRPYPQWVFPHTRPDAPVEQLGAFAALGEQEPVTVSVHALKPLGAVQATVSDLAGPGGALLPATAWDVRVVEHLDKRIHYASDTYLADTPVYLAPLVRPLALDAGTTRRFWLTVRVPANAEPGVYRGNVTLSADGAEQAIPLVLRVLPFQLPSLGGLMYGEYYRIAGSPDDPKARIEADLAAMRDQGMSSVGLCFGVDAECYTVDGENVTFQFDGDTRFEWFMNAYRELGFSAPIVLLSDSGQAAAASAGALGEPAYDRVYVAFHRALAAAATERGWPIIYVQPVDEPGWQEESDRARNLHLLKLLHAAGIPTEQDGPGDAYFEKQAGPYADIWNYNGALGNPETVAQALADGHLITFYNNDVEGYRPEVDRWAYGFFNWRHNMHGAYNWEFRGGRGDLYSDFDADSGDWVHLYLPDGEHLGGPSTGFEGSREGLDDRRYLLLLEALIAEARAKGGAAAQAADGAQAALDDLRARLDAQPRVRSRASWEATLNADAARAAGYEVPEGVTGIVLGDLKQPNGLAFAEYDTVRWLVARQALGLWAALRGEADGADGAELADAPDERVTVVARRDITRLEERPRPVARVPQLAAAPSIDAQVDDAAWADAASVGLALSDGGGAPEMPTEVRFGLHQGTLYVAFVAHEDRTQQMQANITDPTGPVWQDDVVEVFIDPGAGGKRFHQVLINSLGTVARTTSDRRAWDADVRGAARVDAAGNRWLAELAIPVADLELGPRFGLNFGRERRPTEVMELTTWSPTGRSFGVPERFGIAVVEGDIPAAEAIKPSLAMSLTPQFALTTQQSVRATFDVRLPAEAMRTGRIELRLAGEGAVHQATIPAPLADQVVAEIAVGDLPPGDYAISARLVTPDTEPVSAAAKLTRVSAPF